MRLKQHLEIGWIRVIITLVGFVFVVGIFYSTTLSGVESNKQDTIKNSELISVVNERVTSIDKDVAVQSAKIAAIEKQLEDISIDIKDIKNYLLKDK